MGREGNAGRTVRIAFHTLGCRLNQYDTEAMKAALPAGWDCRIVAWDEPADVYVLNSCTVTLKADQKCRQLARQVKRRHPDSRVVVTGCYAQTQPDDLAAIGEIDAVLGIQERERIDRWLPEVLAKEGPLVEVSEYSRRLEFTTRAIDDFDGRTRAFVKVQDGCDLKCSYCLIRVARGPGRSRRWPDVRDQLTLLQQRGFREVVLAGVHLGSYGIDLGEGRALPGLLSRAAGTFPDLRFRLSSLHPNDVTERLLEVFRQYSNVRPYLHLSMQSGSDRVLRAMRRPYAAAQVAEALERAAAVAPHFGLGADVIVGFPGETDEDFRATYDMIAASPLAYLHVFRYSPRPGTPAADLPPVHTETVTERSRALRALSRRLRDRFERSLVGVALEAVVETEHPRPGLVQATTGNYATVLVPDTWPTGALVRVVPDRREQGFLVADEVEAQAEPTPRQEASA